MAQLPWPISVGIWFVESRGGDRFTRQHKPADPAVKTYSGTTGETILMCRDLRQELLLRARGTKYEPLT